MAGGVDSHLRRWVKEQGITVNEFAQLLGRPQKTVHKWVYMGMTPSSRYWPDIYSLTGLAEFKPTQGEFQRRSIATTRRQPPPKRTPSPDHVVLLSRVLRNHLSEAEAVLQFFERSTAETREALRQQLDGREVARFAALLRAILSEERLREFHVATGVSDSLHSTTGGSRHGTDR